MCRLFGSCGKKSTKVASLPPDESRKASSSQSSLSTSDAPAGKFKDEKSIFQRLFGRPMEKTRVITLDKNAGEPKKRHKKPRWWPKSSRAAPAPEELSQRKQCPLTPRQDIVVNVKGGKDRLPDRVLRVLPKKEVNGVFTVPKTLRHQQIKHLGFPNPSQMCYMNSCLQSLLTLEDFVQAIRCQEEAWSSNPDAAIMRLFMDISKCHLSDDLRHKCLLLSKFKHAVSTWNPEFRDFHQKDAHEFLTSVFNQMRCLGTQLKASSPTTYSCPVEDCMLFKMQNVRTCRGCAAGSCTEEEYTHLSLDITPGGDTVEQMLKNYLKQTELEYSCPCGAKTSGTRTQFVNLPRVLILHIKRFRFTPAFQLKKVHDPIDIFRDLVVPSNEGEACFSLVSTINHISPTAINGHYISDGVDLDVGQEDPNDRWFSYNDTVVTETTGKAVCDQRQRSSYILFYRRHD